MAGATPPPGFYFSSISYVYDGTATGSAALSRSLPITGNLPQTTANLKVDAQVGVEAPALLWVAPTQFLGGNVGVGIIAPFGYQGVDVNVNALSTLTLPNGTTLTKGRSFGSSDTTFAVGDPLATAFIGWNAGNWYWKLTGLLNIPIGSYNKTDLVNMGFNHWAVDITGAVTWLDPKTGWEISLAPGFTFNGENPATNYTSGTEFHLEGAVMTHLSKDFALGVAGYQYAQITGDSGSGAMLGPFEGRASAIGPNLTYNFMAGQTPVLTSVRWLHEFDATNRVAGDAGFVTILIPLGGAPAAH